ncbi:PLAC8-domain-containing protein, partial [Polyplosphaeria fusca]
MASLQNQEWKNKSSDCCTPMSSCCLAWWCPCISYGRTHHRVKFDDDMKGYSCCNFSCVAYTSLTCLGLSFVLPMIQRGNMREKYHLKGNGCNDFLCACCCAPCDLLQQDKESKFREDEKTSLTSAQPGNSSQMQYQQQ